MLRLSLFALLLLVFATPALAADAGSTECGVPNEAQLNTDGLVFCDFHSRRLAYGDEDAKFRKLVDERRENYSAPRQNAFHKYQDAVKARHDAYKPEEPESESGPAEEPVGPPAPDGLNP
jgi:hypothetical protein